MRYRRHFTPMLLVLMALVGLCLSSGKAADASDEEQRQQQGGFRKLIKLPDLIDFETFQQIYHKHYSSLLEKLARARLFAANLYRAFVSRVNFIWRRSPKYLAVNMFSDTTVEERRKLLNHDGEKFDHDDGLLKFSDSATMPVVKKAGEVAEESADGWLTSTLKSAAARATEAYTKYSPIERSAPAEGKEWVIHSHPRTGLNDTVDEIFLDYNDSGCMAPIENQGRCSCCYIMSTVAMFEYLYCNQTKTLERFSKQFAIDCGPQYRRQHENPESVRLEGCSGGRDDYAALFFGLYGFRLESEYPFKRVDGECPVSSDEEALQQARITIAPGAEFKYIEVEKWTTENIKFHLETKGPLTISMQLNDEFYFYGGGVDLLEQCDPEGGHGMNIIGYGIEDGREYWLIRNSWTTIWGLSGHYKLWTESRNCIRLIGYATLKFNIKD